MKLVLDIDSFSEESINILKDIYESILYYKLDLLEDNLNLCNSPIERKICASLIIKGYERYEDIIIYDKKNQLHYLKDFDGPSNLLIYPQYKIDRYTVDFLVLVINYYPNGFSCEYLIVECDGHNFHERTKEQAAHDRSRDRFMQKNGYRVLRFTGSEIYKDSNKCADEILSNFYWKNATPIEDLKNDKICELVRKVIR